MGAAAGRVADIASTNVRSLRRIWMGNVSQAEALPQDHARGPMAAATLAALGIVYGDIGTSPLYGFKQAADAAGTISPETIMASRR